VPSLVFHVLEDDTTPFTVCGVTFQPLLGAAPRRTVRCARRWLPYLTRRAAASLQNNGRRQ